MRRSTGLCWLSMAMQGEQPLGLATQKGGVFIEVVRPGIGIRSVGYHTAAEESMLRGGRYRQSAVVDCKHGGDGGYRSVT